MYWSHQISRIIDGFILLFIFTMGHLEWWMLLWILNRKPRKHSSSQNSKGIQLIVVVDVNILWQHFRKLNDFHQRRLTTWHEYIYRSSVGPSMGQSLRKALFHVWYSTKWNIWTVSFMIPFFCYSIIFFFSTSGIYDEKSNRSTLNGRTLGIE